ncbi:hypothetical protein C8Q80DRAFT_1179680 [Daedaleopsis nitida]|nr:hypothetical protein C8Q80DRAFT_1179680 [Daedaleopsis nitida]
MAPGPVNTFTFLDLPGAVTCQPATFTWNYVGEAGTFTFTLSPSVAPHTNLPGTNPRRAVNQRVIATNVADTAKTWTWGSVDAEQGWYTVEAVADSSTWTATSTQFFVTNGTDLSCLYGTTPSSSPSTSIPSTSSGTSTESTSSPTSSPTTVLPVEAATSNRVRTGAIAGAVVGGLIIIGAAIIGYIYFGLCRRAPTRSRRRALDGAQPQLGKWGGLSSRDSGMDAPMAGSGKPALAMVLPSKKHGKTESTGAMLSPISTRAHGRSVAEQVVSDEDLSTLADEEKAYKGQEFIETVPPLAYTRRRSSISGNGGHLKPVASISEPPPSTGSMGRNRPRASSQSHRAMALAKLDGNDPTPASPRARSPTVPRRSFDNPPTAMPASFPHNAAPMSPSSSGGGPMSRRSLRKPVPLLDSSEFPVPPTPTSTGVSVSRGQSLSSTATMASTATPTSAHPMYRNESHSSANLRAPAPVRQHSREDLEAVGMELPSLNHKSSFGNRPVHYLIPDMPPPPRR